MAEAPGPTHWRVIRLALITDRGSACDASSQQQQPGCGKAPLAGRTDMAVPWQSQSGTTLMYRRSPAVLNPASSFIVHLLSRNEPFGTRTIATPFVLRISSILRINILYNCLFSFIFHFNVC